MQGIRILLRAIAEGHANAPEQIQARWTWKLARASRKVQDRRASAEYPEAKRLLGALANSRGHRHEENAARLVAEALKLPLPVGVALLASAEAYTPRATKLLDAAREEIAPQPRSPRALAENLPAPKATPGRSRRRRRKKKGPQRSAAAAADRERAGEQRSAAHGRRRRAAAAQAAPAQAEGPHAPATPDAPAGRRAAARRSRAVALATLADAMLVLLGIGFLAGIITALSPCVLPVLPILLAGGATGGRRRPYAIVAGIVASFTVFTLVAAWLLDLLGLPRGRPAQPRDRAALRARGDADLPPLRPAARAAARAPDPPPRRRPRRRLPARREPRPRLRAVRRARCSPTISVLAAQHKVGFEAVLLTFVYALGAAVPMLLVAIGGQRAAGRLRAHGRAPAPGDGRRRRARGARARVQHRPEPPGRARRLHDGAPAPHRGDRLGAGAAREAAATLAAPPQEPRRTGYGPAPEFTEIAHWLNTPGDRPLTIAGLRGKVVLVDFWTYSCINCIRTLPHLRAWYAAYHPLGLEIVGVHTPEFAFEHVLGNVRAATHDLHVTWPVALDNDYGTWNAYSNEYWPAEYLIDRSGTSATSTSARATTAAPRRRSGRCSPRAPERCPTQLTSVADRTPTGDVDARVVPRLRAARSATPARRSCPNRAVSYRFPFGARAGRARLRRASGRSGRRRSSRASARGCGSTSRRGTSTSCSAAAATSRRSSTASPAGTVDVTGYRLYTLRQRRLGAQRDPRAPLRPGRAGLRVHLRLARVPRPVMLASFWGARRVIAFQKPQDIAGRGTPHCSRAASSSPSSSSRSRRNSVSSAASDSPEGRSSAASIASVRCSSSST